MKTFLPHLLWSGAMLSSSVLLAAAPAAAQGNSNAGAVFVGTNHNNTHPTAPPGEPANQIVMYVRAANGALTQVGVFDTGGQGSGPSVRFAGDGLGSSRSVELTHDGRFLLVTNAGSDDVSVFRVRKDGLDLTDLEPSNGVFPNSVAQHGRLVYVLNSAGDGNITGFSLSNQGDLTPIPNSTRTLDANQDPVRPDVALNPTQVSFTPDGRQLVVTIKDGPAAPNPFGIIPSGPGRVLVFGIGKDGRPSPDYTQTDLDNDGPFGFSFDRHGNLITTLFVGGPGLTGAVGSFRIRPDGLLVPISNVPTFEGDTCWVENNGRFAYSANYASGTISSFGIGNDGSLTLLDRFAARADDLPGGGGKSQGGTPLDIRLSRNGQFVYNILPGSGTVGAWRVNPNGSLSKIGEFPIFLLDGRLLDAVDGDVAPFEFGPGGSPAGIAAL